MTGAKIKIPIALAAQSAPKFPATSCLVAFWTRPPECEAPLVNPASKNLHKAQEQKLAVGQMSAFAERPSFRRRATDRRRGCRGESELCQKLRSKRRTRPSTSPAVRNPHLEQEGRLGRDPVTRLPIIRVRRQFSGRAAAPDRAVRHHPRASRYGIHSRAAVAAKCQIRRSPYILSSARFGR